MNVILLHVCFMEMGNNCIVLFKLTARSFPVILTLIIVKINGSRPFCQIHHKSETDNLGLSEKNVFRVVALLH